MVCYAIQELFYVVEYINPLFYGFIVLTRLSSLQGSKRRIPCTLLVFLCVNLLCMIFKIKSSVEFIQVYGTKYAFTYFLR